MTTILWALLAVILVIVIGIGIRIAVSRSSRSSRSSGEGKAPAKAVGKPTERVHRIDNSCVVNGHGYVAYDTGWRCATCGNHVSTRDGEKYGLAKDGLHERRRNPR
jgi:hypothetical protein